jgi:hypothetical protein
MWNAYQVYDLEIIYKSAEISDIREDASGTKINIRTKRLF